MLTGLIVAKIKRRMKVKTKKNDLHLKFWKYQALENVLFAKTHQVVHHQDEEISKCDNVIHLKEGKNAVLGVLTEVAAISISSCMTRSQQVPRVKVP